MFNFAALKRIVAAAGLAGLLAGLLLTAIQQFQIAPLLLKAEVFEDAAADRAPTSASVSHEHSSATDTHQHVDGDGHHAHAHEAWQPANGWQRTSSTLLANIILAIGFALQLGAVIFAHGRATGWRAGLLWGLAGYAVFFAAPSLGLPPELPGTEAANLTDRQAWWLMAVVASGAGLSLLVFVRSWLARLAGVVLLVVPHLIGAPEPEVHASAAPGNLVTAFVYATILANAMFWLCLGGLVGFFNKKMV